jgi:MFS family permease
MRNGSARVGVGAILRVPEFRALWLAEAQSLLGDQLARVALVVLAYRQTGSPAVSALIYALTFLPAIVGGATLSGLADRLPRRTLMICCDVLRAGLLTAMAVPGLPLAVVCSLLVVAVLAGRPFAASQLALLPEVLSGESYAVGSGLRMVTDQLAQLVGFASGGVIVAAIGPRPALLVDAVSFLVSAAIVRGFVRHRPAAAAAKTDGRPGAHSDHSLRTSLAIVFGDAKRRTLLGLGCLAGFHVAPEGLAPAYAAAHGAGARAVGVLMAALPLGTALGVWLLVRLPATLRSRLTGPLSVATAVPLIACALGPGMGASVALWALSGLFAAYQMHASTAFVASVPNHQRGQAVGLATSAVIAAQGLGLIGFGVLADHASATAAVALAGTFALVLAVPLALAWARTSRAQPRDIPTSLPQLAAAERQVEDDA